MYCCQCGKELPDGAQFCPVCGARQARGTPVRSVQGDRTGASKVSPEQPVSQSPTPGAAPAAAKKKARDYTYWLLAAISVIVSLMNIHDMKSDGIYTVILGIPIQYVMLPMAVVFAVLGIRELAEKKKS